MNASAPPLRRVLQFAECVDIHPSTGERRRLVRMRLECHHTIYRHDETAGAEMHQECRDCQLGKRVAGVSKAALAKWGL